MEVLHSWLVRMLHMHEVIGSSPITSTKSISSRNPRERYKTSGGIAQLVRAFA